MKESVHVMHATVTSAVSWPWGSPNPALPVGDDVHIWCGSLDRLAADAERLQETLSDDERERARRFHFSADRLRYLVARGFLRIILARYLNTRASTLRFSYGAHGKPILGAGESAVRLQFNVSHSDELVLYAFATGHRDIGVDVERVRPIPDLTKIASRFFSSRENRELAALNSDQQLQGFFNCWTRKEAYIKAVGKGLSHSLDSFDVALAPDAPVNILAIRENADAASDWVLRAFAPAVGYAAALAVRTQEINLHCWQVPPLAGLTRDSRTDCTVSQDI